MDWINICVLLAFVIYLTYNVFVLSFFGVPRSLSDTYYLFNRKKKNLGLVFSIMLISIVSLLLPAWLEISNYSEYQFASFMAAASLFFVGIAPAFNKHKLENHVHMLSAIIAVIFAILWIILVSNQFLILIIYLTLIALISYITKTFKTSYIYWLETAVFLSTFASILTLL